MERAIRALLAMLALGIGGCAEYSYEPAARVNQTGRNHTAITYAFPPANPHGTLRVRAVGVESTKGVQPSSLHLRMFVENSGVKPWLLDTQQQVVSLPDGTELRPVEAGSVTVPAGAVRVVDLHFALPPGYDRARHLPRFAAVSTVDIDGRALSERTPFARIEQGPTMPCGAYADPYCLSGYAGGG